MITPTSARSIHSRLASNSLVGPNQSPGRKVGTAHRSATCFGEQCPPYKKGIVQLIAAGLLVLSGVSGNAFSEETDSEPINIGSRRELFVDSYLIERLTGGAEQELHHPVSREIVIKHDAEWEGTGSGYHSIFHDGERYRMYYKSWHLDVKQGSVNTASHPLYCCYAESDDGITWRKPSLGLHEFKGSRKNNITAASGKLGPLNLDAGHPAVFLDENPNATPDAKYKAIFRSEKPNGLLPFKSPDGLNWTPMTDAPILHHQGAFDSQNLAFWDANIGKYRAYWRYFTKGKTTDEEWKPGGIRAIRTATSDDLINWDRQEDLTYADSPPTQLYTNQIKPYHRAPHILIGFPTRYIERKWSESLSALPNVEGRKQRSSAAERYGTAITDALFMASRDGSHFKRYDESFLRPGIERPGTWHYGHQYIGWHLVETKSQLAGAPNELSLYAVEAYWHGKGSALRRYTLRLDGFVSVNGSAKPGATMTTKTVSFTGDKLHLNFSTSAAGSIRVELQQPDGTPIEGFAMEDCNEVFGDSVDRIVGWKNGKSLKTLNGTPVRLRFELQDANLYSMQFTD